MEPAPTLLNLTPSKGFTLVEMMVVLAIITVITSIALLGQGTFNRSLILTDTAYTVAFSIREAQSLGISSRKAGSIQNAGYGVQFASGAQATYTLFADTLPVQQGNIQSAALCPGHTVGTGAEARPGDCIYGDPSEIVRRYSLNNGMTVKSFCATTASGTQHCNGYLDALNISYLRPSTQASIVGVRSGTRLAYVDATIRIMSADGAAERCVYVTKVGQVSVQQKGDALCP